MVEEIPLEVKAGDEDLNTCQMVIDAFDKVKINSVKDEPHPIFEDSILDKNDAKITGDEPAYEAANLPSQLYQHKTWH